MGPESVILPSTHVTRALNELESVPTLWKSFGSSHHVVERLKPQWWGPKPAETLWPAQGSPAVFESDGAASRCSILLGPGASRPALTPAARGPHWAV